MRTIESMAVYPNARFLPLPENNTQPRIRPISVIVHTHVGNPTLEGARSALLNADGEHHFNLRVGGVELAQYIDTEVRADNNWKANSFEFGGRRSGAISIETGDKFRSGDPDLNHSFSDLDEFEPTFGRYDVSKAFGGGTALLNNPWTNALGKTCPGRGKIDEFPRLLKAVQHRLNGADRTRTRTTPPNHGRPSSLQAKAGWRSPGEPSATKSAGARSARSTAGGRFTQATKSFSRPPDSSVSDRRSPEVGHVAETRISTLNLDDVDETAVIERTSIAPAATLFGASVEGPPTSRLAKWWQRLKIPLLLIVIGVLAVGIYRLNRVAFVVALVSVNLLLLAAAVLDRPSLRPAPESRWSAWVPRICYPLGLLLGIVVAVGRTNGGPRIAAIVVLVGLHAVAAAAFLTLLGHKLPTWKSISKGQLVASTVIGLTALGLAVYVDVQQVYRTFGIATQLYTILVIVAVVGTGAATINYMRSTTKARLPSLSVVVGFVCLVGGMTARWLERAMGPGCPAGSGPAVRRSRSVGTASCGPGPCPG